MESTISTWLEGQIQHVDTNPYGLSKAIGVSHVTVGKWLNGVYIPDPPNCRKLAAFFHVPEPQVLVLAGHLSANPAAAHNPLAMYATDTDPDLATVLRLFEELDAHDRHRILAIMRTLRSIENE